MTTLILNTEKGLRTLKSFAPDLLNQLKTDSTVVIYTDTKPDFSNVPELYNDDEKIVLFNQFQFVDSFAPLNKHLSTFKNVKFLLSPYSSFTGLDIELLKKLSIQYSNNAGANAPAVAQYAITCMFMLLSKFPVFTQSKQMPDASIMGEEYQSKTAGIIGMGNVGQELIKILQSLGIETVYYNRTDKKVPVKRVEFKDIFQQDIIFTAIASNPETIELLSDLPNLLQPHNYLIDSSCIDNLYDKKKVIEKLEKDEIRGYAFEAANIEQFNRKSKKNLIITPHMAWCTEDAERRTAVNYLEKALKVVRGQTKETDFIV